MKERKLFIHIGLHKTGTTFLQTSIFNRLKDVHYLQGNLINEMTIPINGTPRNVLISSEALSGRPYVGQPHIKNKTLLCHRYLDSFNVSVRNMKRIFSAAEIIIFVRKHEDFILSFYRHYIKRGGVRKFDEFYGENGVIAPHEILLKPKIKLLNETFNKVHIFDYQDLVDTPSETILKLLSILEESNISNNQAKSRVNVSVRGWRVEAIRRYNRIFYILPVIIQNILTRIYLNPELLFTKILSFIPSKSSEFDGDTKISISKSFEEDWKYIEKVKIKIS
jgi:hypothetical protein